MTCLKGEFQIMSVLAQLNLINCNYLALKPSDLVSYSFSHNHGFVENGKLFERYDPVGDTPIFDFHDYGRKCKLQVAIPHSGILPRKITLPETNIYSGCWKMGAPLSRCISY